MSSRRSLSTVLPPLIITFFNVQGSPERVSTGANGARLEINLKKDPHHVVMELPLNVGFPFMRGHEYLVVYGLVIDRNVFDEPEHFMRVREFVGKRGSLLSAVLVDFHPANY